jgi:hypothetical protein
MVMEQLPMMLQKETLTFLQLLLIQQTVKIKFDAPIKMQQYTHSKRTDSLCCAELQEKNSYSLL